MESTPAPVSRPLPECLRTTDGRVFCPPRMADGRAFTDYRPHCATIATSLAATYGNEQARTWLVNNSESLIANARQLSLHKNACNSCDTTTMANGDVVAPAATQVCTAEVCGVVRGFPGGFGLARKYGSADYIAAIPGHIDQTFKSRGVVGVSATCTTDEEKDVAWGGFHASVTPSMAGKR